MIEYGFLILSLAAAFGFFMACAIGANDVANAMGISVGANVLTLRQAIIIATIFEALGSILASGNVTSTISHGIINVSVLDHNPYLLINGMMSSLLASGVWLCLASWQGWPVSTTHTIIGAVLGFGLTCVGIDNIEWSNIISIFVSWIITPLFSGLCSYILFRFVKKTIFDSDKPARMAKKTVPYYVFVVVSIMISVVFFGSLESLGIVIDRNVSLFLIAIISGICSLISYFLLKKIELHEAQKSLKDSYRLVEKVFGLLAVVTACSMAFAHGSNDVANAIAPLAAISAIVGTGSTAISGVAIPGWIFFLGAFGIVIGLSFYGYKVIATIGNNITDLTPSRGFVAQ